MINNLAVYLKDYIISEGALYNELPVQRDFIYEVLLWISDG